jgi:ferrous iron transport protein B
MNSAVLQPAPRPHRQPIVAVIGNPNTGKSTLFNALTGLRQKTANYPGVTVERHTGTLDVDGHRVDLVDLPGTYSLAAQSPDEMVAIDVLLGHLEDLPRPSAVLAVVDAANLRRNLFLVTQLAELGLPLVIALNMVDLARAHGIEIDAARLGQELGAIVVPLVATRESGLDELRAAIGAALRAGQAPAVNVLPDLRRAASELGDQARAAGHHLQDYEVERALIDVGGIAERRFEMATSPDLSMALGERRAALSGKESLAAQEARLRYAFIGRVMHEVQHRSVTRATLQDVLDRLTNHTVIGPLLFLVVMATVFQAVFSWATPLKDLIDAGMATLSVMVRNTLPPGALSSLLVDGAIAGVGSVIGFLPQVMILFAFIIFLEDSGYMPRVAFVIDRLMRLCGLSGQSFIPMLSSFACAVPGIMASRVIPERRDRLATILAAPFITCSARLPVYALLIGAFVPDERWAGGALNLRGAVLFGLYLLGIVGAVGTALLLKRTALRGPTPTFLIELPPYRLPNLRSIALRLLERGKVFLTRAGTVIFSVAVVIWSLAYFPHPASLQQAFDARRAEVRATVAAPAQAAQLQALDDQQAAAYLEQSALGRMGKAVAPAFLPLGWDWKVTAAVLAGFPAREVIVAVLGTIYAVGDVSGSGTAALSERLHAATWPDGRPVFTLGVACGLLVFYALCLQCAATIAIIRRETGSWAWPLFAWAYMTTLGYLGALAAVHLVD